jgi:hypothetical protein
LHQRSWLKPDWLIATSVLLLGNPTRRSCGVGSRVSRQGLVSGAFVTQIWIVKPSNLLLATIVIELTSKKFSPAASSKSRHRSRNKFCSGHYEQAACREGCANYRCVFVLVAICICGTFVPRINAPTFLSLPSNPRGCAVIQRGPQRAPTFQSRHLWSRMVEFESRVRFFYFLQTASSWYI